MATLRDYGITDDLIAGGLQHNTLHGQTQPSPESSPMAPQMAQNVLAPQPAPPPQDPFVNVRPEPPAPPGTFQYPSPDPLGLLKFKRGWDRAMEQRGKAELANPMTSTGDAWTDQQNAKNYLAGNVAVAFGWPSDLLHAGVNVMAGNAAVEQGARMGLPPQEQDELATQVQQNVTGLIDPNRARAGEPTLGTAQIGRWLGGDPSDPYFAMGEIMQPLDALFPTAKALGLSAGALGGYMYLMHKMGSPGVQNVGKFGQLGALIGPKAKNFNKLNAERAFEMKRLGVDDDAIWRETGTELLPGPDGNLHPVQEVSDAGFVNRKEAEHTIREAKNRLERWESGWRGGFEEGDDPTVEWKADIKQAEKALAEMDNYPANSLGNMVYHPELWKAYPELPGVVGWRMDKVGEAQAGTGWYSPREGPEGGTIVNTSPWGSRGVQVDAHEIYHAVENAEGRFRGVSPRLFPDIPEQVIEGFNGVREEVDNALASNPDLNQEEFILENLMEEMQGTGKGGPWASLASMSEENFVQLRDAILNNETLAQPQTRYMREIGEALARVNSYSLGMGPEGRAAMRPTARLLGPKEKAHDVSKDTLTMAPSNQAKFGQPGFDAVGKTSPQSVLPENRIASALESPQPVLDPNTPNVLAAAQQDTYTPDQLVNYLSKRGVKQEELDDLGITNWLADKTKVTRDEVLAQIEKNRPNLKWEIRGAPMPGDKVQAETELASKLRDAGFSIDQYMNSGRQERSYIDDTIRFRDEVARDLPKWQHGVFKPQGRKLVPIEADPEDFSANGPAHSISFEMEVLESIFPGEYEGMKFDLSDADMATFSTPEGSAVAFQGTTPDGRYYWLIPERVDSPNDGFPEQWTWHMVDDSPKVERTIRDMAQERIHDQIGFDPEGQSVIPQHTNSLQYADYATAGADSPEAKYRVAILRDPNIEYDEAHYGKGALGWTRTTVRDTPDGKKVLLIEELQMPIHQEGKKRGYYDPETGVFSGKSQDEVLKHIDDEFGKSIKVDDDGDYVIVNEYGDQEASYASKKEAVADLMEQYKDYPEMPVPNAPYKKSWPDVLFRKALEIAREEGADYIAWAPAAEHYGRYEGLATLESPYEIRVIKSGDDYNLDAPYLDDYNRDAGSFSYYTPDIEELLKNFPESVREEVRIAVEKLNDGDSVLWMPGESGGINAPKLSKWPEVIGSQGMQNFYDVEVPRRAKKITKKRPQHIEIVIGKEHGVYIEGEEVGVFPSAEEAQHFADNEVSVPAAIKPTGKTTEYKVQAIPLNDDLAASAGDVLTEAEFRKKYMMHTDIRGRDAGTSSLDSVREEGFRGGGTTNLGAIRARGETGWKPTYYPEAGDTVYLVPNTLAGKTVSGRPSVPDGWKPGPGESFVLREGEDVYDGYQRALKEQTMSERPGLVGTSQANTMAGVSAASSVPYSRASWVYDESIPDAPPGSSTTTEVGQKLHREAIEKHGGPVDYTPENVSYIATNIADEVEAAARHQPDAEHWYAGNLAEAHGYVAQRHPEVLTDPNARMAFDLATAITSNGQDVFKNAKDALKVYEYFKANGRFPESGVISAERAGAMYRSFGDMNEILDRDGPEALRRFLATEFTVRELKDAGYNISGENMDTKLHGSAILGPKIGGGFYQNLSGNFDPVTFDLWFQRTWGRHTGTLLHSQQVRDKAMAKVRALLAPDVITREVRALAREHGYSIPELRKLKNAEMLAEFAQIAYRRYSSGGFKNRTEFNRAAKALTEKSGMRAAPAGGKERAYMREVINEARRQLEARGLNLNNASIQALLWYFEKRNFAKLGVRPPGDKDDYATAFRTIIGAETERQPSN